MNGATFLNVRPEDADAGSEDLWAFVRYVLLRGNVIYGELARDSLFDAKGSSSSPAAARATLERALEADSDAVGGFCVCVREES